MKIYNDNNCSWIIELVPRTNVKILRSNEDCEWLIIGAGYTGLSAARKLGQLYPNQKIILVDAQLAGEGASSRNSGYLVDTTLNDGFTSNKELESYKKKADIYELGINTVKKFINDYQVDCDWNECGKYFASSRIEDKKILTNFSEILSKLGFEHNLLSYNDLSKRLGTNFYNVALHTKGGILLHPGKLARAMVDVLPKNVCLYENSSLLSWNKTKDIISCEFKNGKAIIFPATPGSGKSTLATYFGLHGWDLFSDEMAIIPLGSNRVVPMHRAASLKNTSIDVIKQSCPDAKFSPTTLGTHKGDIAHVKLKSRTEFEQLSDAEIVAVVFPKYKAENELVVEQVSQVQGFAKLVHHSFNYSVLGGKGFSTLQKVVEKSDFYTASYSSYDGLEKFLMSVIET